MKKLLIVVVGIAAVLWWADHSATEDAEASAFDTRPIVNATVDEYQSAWLENELAAKERFGQNRVRIAGEALNVETNATGDAILHMKVSSPALPPFVLHFAPDQQPQLASVAAGQRVEAICSKADILFGIPVLMACRWEEGGAK